MKEGRGDATGPPDAPLPRSSWTDVALLAVVVGVIIAAVLIRAVGSSDRRAEGTPPATVAQGKAGALAFAIPGARDDVKHDLRNLVTAQEWVFADSIHYVNDVFLLTRERGLVLTSGATIRITWAAEAGWAATAESPRLGGSCVIWIGGVPDSLRPRTKLQHRDAPEAQPRCDGDP